MRIVIEGYFAKERFSRYDSYGVRSSFIWRVIIVNKDILKLLTGKKSGTAVQQVKAKIASSYSSDAIDFKIRANAAHNYLINAEFYRHTLSTKLAVDIVMGIECTLKACIIHLSNKTENHIDIYCVCRKYSHNIRDLWRDVQNRAKGRFSLNKKEYKIDKTLIEIMDKLSKLNVEARYHLDTLKISRRQQNSANMTIVQKMVDDETSVNHFHLAENIESALNLFSIFLKIENDLYKKYSYKHLSGSLSELSKGKKLFLEFLIKIEDSRKLCKKKKTNSPSMNGRQ